MPQTIYSKRHKKLAELLAKKRKEAGLTQAAVGRALGRHQPFIANIENGDRRVDLIELMDLAEIIGFDVHQMIDELKHSSSSATDGDA